MSRIDVLGVSFDDLGMEAALERALTLIDNKSGAYAVTPNPEIVMLAREDAQFRRALNAAALVLPDGVGVVKGARILDTPFEHGKLAGIDFASALMARLAERGGSVFLFGARPGVAERAGEELKRLHPGLRVLGTADGYFRDDGPIIERIREARPDFLLVCLGFPKQEFWMAENAQKLPVGLMAGLGGSLDVFAGEAKRAPEGWQRLGLEWLYRLLREPKRIGRMMVLPRFILKAAEEKRTRDAKG